jgi:RHS repeat-associated protein
MTVTFKVTVIFLSLAKNNYIIPASKYYSFEGQTIVNEYKPATNDWHLSYLLTDHLGSVVAVTDGTGALISQQRYLPFGGKRTNLGTISQTDYGYTGQRDLEMGLMDYKARFYNPLLGRFMQPDTLTPDGPQGLNRYSYVGNNPIGFNDPSGHIRIGDGPESNKSGCTNPFYCAHGKPNVHKPRPHPNTEPLPSRETVEDNYGGLGIDLKPVDTGEKCADLFVYEFCGSYSSTFTPGDPTITISRDTISVDLSKNGSFEISKEFGLTIWTPSLSATVGNTTSSTKLGFEGSMFDKSKYILNSGYSRGMLGGTLNAGATLSAEYKVRNALILVAAPVAVGWLYMRITTGTIGVGCEFEGMPC